VGVAVLVLAVAGAACGSDADGASRVVDREQVESLLVQRQRERNPRLRVESASCPEHVVARPGETFECTVVVEGQPAPFGEELVDRDPRGVGGVGAGRRGR